MIISRFCNSDRPQDKENKETVLVFRGQNEDTQTREVGWNKYITITEQIYKIQVLLQLLGTVRQLGGYLPKCQVESIYIEEE